jgi:hypothetical protein
MGLTTNGLPAMAASGNRTVAVVTTPEGGLVWTSWELGHGRVFQSTGLSSRLMLRQPCPSERPEAVRRCGWLSRTR